MEFSSGMTDDLTRRFFFMTCVFSFNFLDLHRCKEVQDNERHRTREQSTSGVFLLLCTVRSFVCERLLCIAFLRLRSFRLFFFSPCFFALLTLQTTAPMQTENK